MCFLYRFWSNVVSNPAIMDTAVSFLQEAPPYYALDNFPTDPEMRQFLEKLRHNVLVMFARLVTNKESPAEHMTRSYHAKLMYNNYIFTIPILMDLCQQYGRDNKKTIQKILNCVFTIQPLYKDDLSKAVTFLVQVMRQSISVSTNAYQNIVY